MKKYSELTVITKAKDLANYRNQHLILSKQTLKERQDKIKGASI